MSGLETESGPKTRASLHGVLPVVPTPFINGEIDYDSLHRLFEWIFPALDGCTLGGSTGEAASLSLDERLAVMRFAAKHAAPGKKFVIALTDTNLESAKILAREAAGLGLEAGLVPAPYYFPNTPEMVLKYITALGEASDLPLVFYDNPVYTKTWLRAEELIAMANAGKNLKAVKLTDHNLDKIQTLRSAGISVFVGDDVVAFRSLLLGADGSMIIAPAVFPEAYMETVRLLTEGDPHGALEVFSARILPFIHLFGVGDEISVTKELFHRIGVFRSAELRLPLLPPSSHRMDQVMLAYNYCKRNDAPPTR